jgi:hypothetical protein
MKTAMGRVWHPAQLQARIDLSDRLIGLGPREWLTVDRHVEGDRP